MLITAILHIENSLISSLYELKSFKFEEVEFYDILPIALKGRRTNQLMLVTF